MKNLLKVVLEVLKVVLEVLEVISVVPWMSLLVLEVINRSLLRKGSFLQGAPYDDFHVRILLTGLCMVISLHSLCRGLLMKSVCVCVRVSVCVSVRVCMSLSLRVCVYECVFACVQACARLYV